MSEANFQKALFHLYRNIQKYEECSDNIFSSFVLTNDETRALSEMMNGQRRGLITFNEQLQNKHCRYIRHALPSSSERFPRCLEEYINSYISELSSDYLNDAFNALKSFAKFLRIVTSNEQNLTRELEFIHFEATYASIILGALHRPATAHNSRISPNSRVADDGSVSLIASSYDLWAALRNPSMQRGEEILPRPCWFLLFAKQDGELKVIKVSNNLFALLKLLVSGLTIGEALESYQLSAQRDAANASIGRLMSIGFPIT